MGYKHIRRCDDKEIKKLKKYRQDLHDGKVYDDDAQLKATVLKFPNNTKREHETARNALVYGNKVADSDGMRDFNIYLQKQNKLAILREINEHYVSVPVLIQDIHGKKKFIDFLRMVSGKDAVEAARRFEDTYRPKIEHLEQIGNNPEVKKELKKTLRKIEQEAGIQ